MKTSELTDKALDWAVAKALGFRFGHWQINNAGYVNVWAELLDDRGCGPAGYFPEDDRFQYSTSWAAGGPIIDREKITVSDFDGGWAAGYNGMLNSFGPTPLIAVCRCFVAFRLGVEVDVPEELV